MQLIPDASKFSEMSRCLAWHDGWPFLRWASTESRRFHDGASARGSSPVPLSLAPSVLNHRRSVEAEKKMSFSKDRVKGFIFTVTQWYKLFKRKIQLHSKVLSKYPVKTAASSWLPQHWCIKTTVKTAPSKCHVPEHLGDPLLTLQA